MKTAITNGLRLMQLATSKDERDRYNVIHDTIMQGDSEYMELQEAIDSGSVWHGEGHGGRVAMQALKDGACICSSEPHADYYGNTVPAWWMLKESTGSLVNSEEYYS